MRDLAVLLTWIALIPAAFFRPYVGVMLWDWTAFIAPNAYVYTFMAGVEFNKIVVGVTALATFGSREPKKIHWDATLILLLVLLAQGTISYLLSGNNTAAPDIFNKFWKECLLCLFINMMITDRLRLHSMIGISGIALGFHGVVEGLKVIASGGQHHIEGLPSIGDNNQFALAILMILPMLNYLSRQSVHRLVKYGWLAAMVLGCLAVVGTWSRGGLIGLGVLAVGFVLLNKNRLRATIVVGIVAAAIVSLASVQYYNRISTIDTADADTSFMGRVLAWEVSFAIARAHPVFGGGFHGVQDPKIWGAYISKVTIPDALKSSPLPRYKAAHSIYFEVMGDLGFVGFALFMALLYLGFRNVNRVIRYSKRKPELQWIYDLGVMCRLTLIVYAVSGAGVSMAWFEFIYVVLTLIAVLARFTRELEAMPVDETEQAPTTARAVPLFENAVGRLAASGAPTGRPG